jgi:anti-sigma regulatory factor (Ser/Thr protein kinase)
VKEAREAVAGAIAALPLDEETVEDVRLCVSEAMTNAVRHACAGQGGTVDVSVARKGDAVVVVVRDSGASIVASPWRNGSGGYASRSSPR